jgi:radical SAM superfamily enzyme YgiQ (UPF0313 family)
MRPLKIYLGDLSYYNDNNKRGLYVPVNIGFLASYTKKLFGNDVEITLFKDPSKLLDAVASSSPDILGLSFYNWNTQMNHALTRQVRAKLGSDVVIVWGGPSVDTDSNERARLFKRFPEVDAFVSNEGELGFVNIVRERIGNNSTLWGSPIDGVVFTDNGALVSGEEVGLSLDLHQLDSPYLGGYLDSFLNEDYFPLLQTSRLCPYTCTFCVSGKNQGKLRGFPLEQVKGEIDYIAHYYKDNPHLMMYIVDENFGILPQDMEIANHIRWSFENRGYPRGMFFYNDKRFSKVARHVISKLGDLTRCGLVLSLQTETEETLKEIKRNNLSPEDIDEAIQWASENDLQATTELIFGLPYETRESFVDMLNNAVRRGFDSILINNLFIMDGIEMTHGSFRERHEIKTKLRPIRTNYGFVGSEFCVETQELVIGTKTISFNDFVMMRQLNFMFYAIFSMDFYKWFFQYIRQLGIPLADYLTHFVNESEGNRAKNENWNRFMKDLKEDALKEQFDSQEEANSHFLEMYKANGNESGPPTMINPYYGARLIYMENDWLKEVMLDILGKFINPQQEPDTFEIASFLIELCHRERIELVYRIPPEPLVSKFNVITWKKNKFRLPLSSYKIKPVTISFEEDIQFKEKIDKVKKLFLSRKPAEFYYNAYNFIVPQSQLLYNISYDSAPIKIVSDDLESALGVTYSK